MIGDSNENNRLHIDCSFLASSVTAFAETRTESPKKDIIEAQEAAANKAIEDTKVEKPSIEARPAATTKHKKYSTQSHKADMIKHNKKETHKSIKDAEAANKPVADVLPAAN